ncbi:histidine kinase CKI1-like protein [Tanacetum coccineum]
MIPRVSQISYIRKDGMVFALYSKDQQVIAIYSNTSFSEATKARRNYAWYTQHVDSDTGKLYGDVVVFPPQLLDNESWFQKALNTTHHPFASLGHSWHDVDNPLVLSTARVGDNEVVSLGFELKSLMNMLRGIIPFGGGFYLATKDGNVLGDGIPNTRLVLDGNATICFQRLRANGDRNVKEYKTVLRLSYQTPQVYILENAGTKYILYSSSLDITGIQSVYVLALPYDGLQSKMHKNIVFLFVLMALMFFVICIVNFVDLLVVAARKEMCLTSEIKNRDLEFVKASHDIRASLAGITGMIEMSINDLPQGSELAKNLKRVKSRSEDLKMLLNSILDKSKNEARKIQPEEKPFDLIKVLEEQVDLFYPVGQRKGLDVILDLGDGSLSKHSQVKGDKVKLKQILANLLSNAVKFTKEGYVSVRCRAHAINSRVQTSTPSSTGDKLTRCLLCFYPKVNKKFGIMERINKVHSDPNYMEFVFEVIDTGKGIPKDKRVSVFENYVQVKETTPKHEGNGLGLGIETAPEHEGTGLGLGIVQSLVRLMGGDISIVDNKVGKKGTCFAFNVVLDVCLSNSRNIHEDDKTLSSGSTTPLRSPKRLDDNSSIVVIFISSDERRRVIQEFLRAHKIKVLAVKNIVELSQTLRMLKQEQEKVSSSKSYLNKSFGCLSWPRSRSSNTSPKNVPLSAMDGTDVSPTQSTNSLTLSSFILLVLDTTRANFRELSKVVAEFRKDSKNESFRVVWLGSRCIKLQGLDENQLPPSDLIIPMPVHGTRLNSLINLLPEFGGMFPSTPPHQNQPTPREVEETQIITRDEQTLRKQEGPTEITKSSPLGEKVLLADNEPCQHMIVQKLLSRYGVTTTSCLNGKQALDMVTKGLNDQRNIGASHILPYDYIFMDCQMPDMDGFEATKHIRLVEKNYGVHIPIIGLTAHEEGEELNKMFAAGIDIYVSKPLDDQKVLKLIEDLQYTKIRRMTEDVQ